ncbi:MAG: SEL1-like repeat protein [Proteobacteria bacterium]|nr:SEL1-like repeat protein [Pseudomonadota bacterium]
MTKPFLLETALGKIQKITETYPEIGAEINKLSHSLLSDGVDKKHISFFISEILGFGEMVEGISEPVPHRISRVEGKPVPGYLKKKSEDLMKAIENRVSRGGQDPLNLKTILGVAYLHGVGVKRDSEKGLKYLSASDSALARYEIAAHHLNELYAGNGNEHSKEIIAENLEPYASSEIVSVRHSVAMFLLLDPLEEDVALEILQKCKNKGFALSINELGNYHFRRDEFDLAKENYELAHGMGLFFATHSLGNFHLSENPKQAFEYFKIAADAGYAPSKHNLAICYRDGVGTEKDDVKALLSFAEGSLQGHKTSQAEMLVHALNKKTFESATRLSEAEAKLIVVSLGIIDEREFLGGNIFGENVRSEFIENIHKLIQ